MPMSTDRIRIFAPVLLALYRYRRVGPRRIQAHNAQPPAVSSAAAAATSANACTPMKQSKGHEDMELRAKAAKLEQRPGGRHGCGSSSPTAVAAKPPVPMGQYRFRVSPYSAMRSRRMQSRNSFGNDWMNRENARRSGDDRPTCQLVDLA